MSETGLGPLPTSKMQLFVAITNGSPTYAKYPVLARRLPNVSSTFTYYLHYLYYCYPIKSSALIILLRLLYFFASKPGKIYTRNSIDSILITSSVVCSEFNHSPFTIMVKVKRIIFNYFVFF